MLLQTSILVILSLCFFPSSLGGPVPIVEDVVEEGLLVLVPTLPVNKYGQPTKREIEYELIMMPADVIKRTVRDVLSGTTSSDDPVAGSIYITDLNTNDQDEFIITSRNVLEGSESERYSISASDNAFLNGIDNDDFLITGGTSYNDGNLPILSSSDLGKILSSVATAGLTAASSGANFAGQAKSALQTATRVGASAVVGGTQAVKWVLQQKATGLRSFAEFAGTGLNYAGRLSSAVLKVLFKIPGIKARVISDLIQAGQPLASAVSEVFSENADDLSDIFSSHTGLFKDAINILFKLITDVLALKGRVLSGFTSGGLDGGATLITTAVRVGSAFVQTAGDVVSTLGRGVGEFIKVASEANLPPPPQLPKITFPLLPQITYPKTSNSDESYDSKGTLNYNT